MTPRLQLDRYTTMGDLTASVRHMLSRANKYIVALLVVAAAYLVSTNAPGAMAFVMIACGASIALVAWSGKGIGLPLLPMLAVQHLVAYGLPIAVHHKIVTAYAPEHVLAAGLDVLVFLGAAALGWRLGMQMMTPGSPRAYALEGIDRQGVQGLKRLGFSLITVSTMFLVLQSVGLVDTLLSMLPGGLYPVVWAGISAMSTCGFFLVSMLVTSASTAGWQRAMFWTLLTVNCLISASGFLLSAAATTSVSVMIGQFWSTGRVSARFIIGVVGVLAFLNLGKFTMRERYWQRGDDGVPDAPRKTFADLPAYYLEWSRASYDALTGSGKSAEFEAQFRSKQQPEREGQSLLERINNLQNLLFVIDAVETGHIAPLRGATYSLIPPLLIPRFLWPNKPRTHEGQVLLNTHFGRQDLESTFTTYVAWGLLPEAYGNFGAITGALILGAVVGLFCAWMENLTTRKPLLSTEGFISFAIFLGLATSYEMVASVMITSIFQAVVPIAIACLPFVRRTALRRPAPEPA